MTIAPYGYCPTCGSPGVARERRLNGNDTCQQGHIYPSSAAQKFAAPVADEDLSRLAEFDPRTYAPCTITPIPDPDELIALLRQAEWSVSDDMHSDFDRCPWCCAKRRTGHTPTCPVAPILYPKEQG